MLRKRSKTVLSASLFTVIIISLLLIFEIRVPNSIYTYFEVHPQQKWILSRGNEGQIISNIIDFTSMISNNFTIVQFERGESMNFKLLPSVAVLSSVSKGDTIGIIKSSKLQERIIELEGELLIAKANLAARSTGEKQELIEEAKNKIKYSEAKIQEQRTLFNRADELVKKEYISKSEYELSLWNLKQYEIQNEIDKARLASLTSGSKTEDLHVLRSIINNYGRELNLQQNRLSDFVLTAPISGEILREYSLDTILAVNNISTLILTAPIRYEKTGFLLEGQKIFIKLRNYSEPIPGRITSISKEIKYLSGAQVTLCRIHVESPPQNLIPGLLVQGQILLPDVTVKEYLFSLFDH
jgi:hypothetical protein